MEINIGANSFEKLRHTFPNLGLPSLKVLRKEMSALAGIHVTRHDCCPNSCMAYTGPYATLKNCTYCNTPRYRSDGVSPIKQFHYLPLIPQTKALYAGASSAAAMKYRSEHENDNIDDLGGTISDIYDSELYRWLRTQDVVVNGRTHPYKYFSDPHDVLLIALTDGFQLFKRGKHTAWPLLFINGNLDPAGGRYSVDSVICVGLIPGPKKPKNFDSFMHVVVEELNVAAAGVPAYDADADIEFDLRIFGPLGCGDLPAMAVAFTGAKSHGSVHACRGCPHEGICMHNSSNKSYYLPMIRPPGYPVYNYSADNMPPFRTHKQWMWQADRVDRATTQAEADRRSRKYGINGTAITARIPGVQFPISYPFDLMHLIENTLHNYVLLICGDFKQLDAGEESYIINKATWKEIGTLTVEANATIPSTFGRRIMNIAEDRTYFTAEAYLVWSTLYAPIILRGRFDDERYYHHYKRLISVIERCMDLSSTREDRIKLRADIVEWYKEYES